MDHMWSFACSTCICMGSLQVLQFPAASQEHTSRWTGHSNLPLGVKVQMGVFIMPCNGNAFTSRVYSRTVSRVGTWSEMKVALRRSELNSTDDICHGTHAHQFGWLFTGTPLLRSWGRSNFKEQKSDVYFRPLDHHSLICLITKCCWMTPTVMHMGID